MASCTETPPSLSPALIPPLLYLTTVADCFPTHLSNVSVSSSSSSPPSSHVLSVALLPPPSGQRRRSSSCQDFHSSVPQHVRDVSPLVDRRLKMAFPCEKSHWQTNQSERWKEQIPHKKCLGVKQLLHRDEGNTQHFSSGEIPQCLHTFPAFLLSTVIFPSFSC